jgi:2'-hydroxyisoflavone reductase
MTRELLVLGGTRFVGRAVVEEAIGQGWSVTTLNRGVTGPVPTGAQALTGDRLAPDGLGALNGRSFDAVLDTWTGAPRVVAGAARALQGRVGHYVYVSTRSVYALPWLPDADETAPVVPADPDAEASAYPEDKRGAELALLRQFDPDQVTVLRCGLILGPYEDVGRLPWWLSRVSEGGDVLAPGPMSLPLQFIDVRDLAAFALSCANRRLGATFNVASRSGHTTMGLLLDACRSVTGSDARFVWATPAEVLAAHVEPWTELPVWIPPEHPAAALHQGNVARATAAGLRSRPVAETVAATWAWMTRTAPSRPPADRPPVGLSRERELALLTHISGERRP